MCVGTVCECAFILCASMCVSVLSLCLCVPVWHAAVDPERANRSCQVKPNAQERHLSTPTNGPDRDKVFGVKNSSLRATHFFLNTIFFGFVFFSLSLGAF